MISNGGQEEARRYLVVAVGNAERGDDGIGPEVARRLVGQLPPDIRLVARCDDVLSLVEDWRGCEAVICVDAAAPMGSPGQIHRIDATRDPLPQSLSTTSSHSFGLAEAIALSRALQSLPDKVIVYAIEGTRFEVGGAMTRAVTQAVEEVSALVLGEVRRWQATGTIECTAHA